MTHRMKNKKRGTADSSPLSNRLGKWECSPGNEENLSPVATSSPVLCRRIKKRRQLNISTEKLPKHGQICNYINHVADSSKNESALLFDNESFIEKLFSDDVSDIKNESSVLIKDDSFISHINFEKLDQLTATDPSSIPPPLSPDLFEEKSPRKECQSQASIIPPTLASLSSTLSSQPLVTRIQRNFKNAGK